MGHARHRKAPIRGQRLLRGRLSSLSEAQCSARYLSVDMRSAEHGAASQSKAVSHWRRRFIEVFSLHCAVVQRMAQNKREQQRKATRPALHGGLSESFSAQRRARHSKARQRIATQVKATRQGHSMSGFVEGLSSQCNAQRRQAVEITASQIGAMNLKATR